MQIFARYVFRQTAGAVLLILLSLAGIVWIALALRELNVVTSQGQSGWTLLTITTLALPNLMGIIAPIALLIASIHTLNRLNSDSELIVLTASGAPIWTVARPLLTLAFLISAFVAFVNHVAMPWSFRNLREAIIEMRTDLLTQVIQPGKFTSPEQGLTFHIRERALNGELLGLLMDDSRDKKQSLSYLAERSLIIKQDNAAYLVMMNGHIVRREGNEDPAGIIAFDKYAVDLDQFEPRTAETTDLKPRERYLSELVNPAPDSPSFKQNPGQFRSEIHERFSSPLYPIAFVMIALAAVGGAQSTRQSRLEHIATGFLAAVAVRLTGLAMTNLATLNGAAVPALYAVPLLAIGVSWMLMSRNRPLRTGPSVFDYVRDAIETLGRLVPSRRAAAGAGRR
jgi:lipopolysaccharide export system permease protein